MQHDPHQQYQLNVRVSPPPEYPGGPLTPTPLGSNVNAAFLLRQQFANGTAGVLGCIRFQGPGVQATVQAAAASSECGTVMQPPYAAVATTSMPVSNPAYVPSASNFASGVQLTQHQLQFPDNNVIQQEQQQQPQAVVASNSSMVTNSPNKNNPRT